MTPITAIDQATEFWLRRDSMTEQDKLDAALALIEWPEVDEEMVFAITGVKLDGYRSGAGRTSKLQPHSLQQISHIAFSKRMGDTTDWEAVEAVVDAGTSIRTLCSLTGLSQPWVSRKLRNLKGVPFAEMDSSLKNRGSQ